MTRPDLVDLAPPAHEPAAATFRSVLSVGDPGVSADEPACFRDLNLDQVVAELVRDREEYDLTPFFHAPLRTLDEVAYRHEVFRDLEQTAIRAPVEAFAAEMQTVRRYLRLVSTQRYRYEKERWLLDAVLRYCDAVTALRDGLADLELASRGLTGLRGHLGRYAASERFTVLAAEARRVDDGLAGIRYTLRIRGTRVTVADYHDEADYGREIEETFARFRRHAAADHTVAVPDGGSMDHVEARIAELVARLNPEAFTALDAFCKRNAEFQDPVLARFDREVQFYLAQLEWSERLQATGLAFSYPELAADADELEASGVFDAALATKLAAEGKPVVCNDVRLQRPERILVVTGPNQGGKTTYARAVGQLHYLASLGLPVPARSARTFLPDAIFAHFEREEDVSSLRGKLDDELVRVREILEQATADSVVVLNEIFASTTVADATLLGTEVLGRLATLGCVAVCVTFVDELSSLGEATVSLVAGVEPDDPSRRTFEIARRPADGRAYAWAIAEQHGLSYERLRKKLGP